jgi:hypothetical protein
MRQPSPLTLFRMVASVRREQTHRSRAAVARVVLAVLSLLAINATTAFAQGRLASRFGEANVGGQRVLVHVTVAVPPGADENAVADDALRGQGARPVQAAEFSVNGLVWDQFFDAGNGLVSQNYNFVGAPLPADASLIGSQAVWTQVATSKFAFSYLGTTTRCPSLVKECPEAQVFDGHNDVGWLTISGCCTLAVTWFSTTIDEADMALNLQFPWTTGGSSGYDVQTVMTHENGHVLGLGHSSAAGAIMQATYAGVQHTLSPDDVRGVTYLYPEANAVGAISGTVINSRTGNPVPGVKVNIVGVPVSVTTDASGAFTLTGVPTGFTYTLTASANGYKTATVTNVPVGITPQTISLQPKGR